MDDLKKGKERNLKAMLNGNTKNVIRILYHKVLLDTAKWGQVTSFVKLIKSYVIYLYQTKPMLTYKNNTTTV